MGHGQLASQWNSVDHDQLAFLESPADHDPHCFKNIIHPDSAGQSQQQISQKPVSLIFSRYIKTVPKQPAIINC